MQNGGGGGQGTGAPIGVGFAHGTWPVGHAVGLGTQTGGVGHGGGAPAAVAGGGHQTNSPSRHATVSTTGHGANAKEVEIIANKTTDIIICEIENRRKIFLD